ncbi:MAG: prephenate dehydrogenase [Isosphaeraceae bacterium]
MERLGTVAIIGVGLIGGSIGQSLRARKLASRVVGVGRDQAKLDKAQRLGAIDLATTDPARGVAEAEVVVVCTPVTRIAVDVRQAAAHGPNGVLVTDAGSTKAAIVAAIEADVRARNLFVAAHPIAGSERSGVEHARADLFDGRACVLTPGESTPPDLLIRARSFWQSLGCRITEMTPEAHDAALALTSHFPHALAAALAGIVPTSALPLAGGAYRDGTRVAAADPVLWAGILLENQGAVLDACAAFRDQLDTFHQALSDRDERALIAWWEAARARRLLFGNDGS